MIEVGGFSRRLGFRALRPAAAGVFLLGSLLSDPALAQLDATCTVSVLNRSVPVSPDGVWVLPDVPANQGMVRARATCVANGITRSGQSEFFAVPANGVVQVADIRFDAPAPIPVRLALSAPRTTLTAAGETVQLTATATLPDGSLSDRTAASAGTGYLSSNPGIAEVSAEGVVTARTSGTALISALHEGALAILSLRVVLSGDSDGDGLADDFEIASGLDPNNPVDAVDDADSDGLATRDELAAGLDPFKADTDGDRLSDGDEVNVFRSDPRLRDTDGDRIADGLEIQSGSNPLDPASFNLGPILQTLTVSPRSLSLVYNTIEGEASRRIEVTGRLIDGTELDLRSRRWGTSYASSALSIASFGAEDGRIFAGQDGTAVVTVSNGPVSATVQVRVETFAPTILANLVIPGFANGVAVEDGYAYVAAGAEGLVVVDVSDPARPQIVGSVAVPGNANDVRVRQGLAYVAAGATGLRIVDVRFPAAPVLLGAADTPGVATDVALEGDFAYVADGSAGLQVIEISDPAAPVVRGGLDTPGNARGVDVERGLAVVADELAGAHVIDVSAPSAPRLLGTTHTRPNSMSRAADVVVRGRLAYVPDGVMYASALGGLRVIDFQVPETPVVVATTTDFFGLWAVALEDRFALTGDYYYTNAVPIFDVGGSPVFSAVLDFAAASGIAGIGNGIAVEQGVVYVAGNAATVRDNGERERSYLFIARYRVPMDDAGVPPEVRIASPAAGAEARERTSLAIQAEAADDFGVASVEFLANGTTLARDFKKPFETTVTVPIGSPVLELQAIATDFGGDETRSEPLVVSVLPDDKPAVRFLAPVSGVRIVEGTTIPAVVAASDDVGVAAVELYVGGVLRQRWTVPPYKTDLALPAGSTEILLEARATDSVGQAASTGPVTLPVADDPPPFVAVLAPAPGIPVVAGATVPVTIAATDDLAVTRVRLVVDGQPGAEDASAPYEFTVDIPASASEVRLAADAFDSLGQSSRSEEVVVEVVPDPLTTAEGSVVLPGGGPAAGASVLCHGISGTAGADGTFSIPGVPSAQQEVLCSASFTDASGRSYSGSSGSVAAVPGGATDVGSITVGESLFVTDFGQSLALDCFTSYAELDLPFEFPLFGSAYNRVYINPGGNLTFGAPGYRDTRESGTKMVSGTRLQDGYVGPSIAAFWDNICPVAEYTEAADYYRFSGTQGDVVTISTEALDSRLDTLVTLLDEEGRVVGFNDDAGTNTRYSRLILALPRTGTYFIRLQDRFYGKGSYRLVLRRTQSSLRDAGDEVEPNDKRAQANPLTYDAFIDGSIQSDLLQPAYPRNIFVNDQIPGRLVVTWKQVPEYARGGSNTFQAILFEDGRVQLGYDGMTADDGVVGLSAADGSSPVAVDFSTAVPFGTSRKASIFEEFDGPFGPDAGREDPAGNHPFDLDGRILLFTPNASGGYDVKLAGEPRTDSGL